MRLPFREASKILRPAAGACRRCGRAPALWLVVLGLGAQPSPLIEDTVHAQGTAQTVAATALPLSRPTGIAFDGNGNLYVAETNGNTIVNIDSSGNLTTVAGTGAQGFAGDGGPAAAALLDSPSGVAVDSAGDLYIADTHNQRIRRIDAGTSTIATVAGNGTAGFAGDGGPATAGELDRPGAIAVDTTGNLFVADTNNHRIRRVDAITGTISTVAGNGFQGYAGDGGPAVAASIDSPDGLAVSASGQLYLADTHNQRIRVVDLASGTISTVAGTGVPGNSGDGLAAAQAALAGPRGLALDSKGNLYLAETNNQQIRRIDAVTGAIATAVGTGTQAFLGEGGAESAAALDSPRSVALSPAQALTLADTGNQRVRQVSTDATVHTIAGLGGTAPGTLTLAAPPVVTYGAGVVTATLNTSTPATGSVTFVDATGTSPIALGDVALTANTATLSLSGLDAAAHTLTATYAGDQSHRPAASPEIPVTVTPAALVANANPVTTTYGSPLPATLSGSARGVLPQDGSRVSITFSTTATVVSTPGTYAIAASVAGPAAANYRLSLAPTSGQLTVTPAPVTVSLTSLTNAFAAGAPESFTAQVISTTSGTPTGSATLFDGSTAVQTTQISPSGVAIFTVSSLAAGTHTLTASYTGSPDYLTGASQPFVATVGGGPVTNPAADFTLTSAGATSATVQSGSSTSFSFAIAEQGNGLSSPILLAASGLPLGAVASFAPAQIPPGTPTATVTLTIQVPQAATAASVEMPEAGRFGRVASRASEGGPPAVPITFVVLVLPFWLMRRLKVQSRRALKLMVFAAVSLLLIGATACGNRVFSTATTIQATTYPVTVNATATDANGNALTHSATVMLTVQ